MRVNRASGFSFICFLFAIVMLVAIGPGSVFAAQQFGFGFEAPVYQVGGVEGQDHWIDVYGSGSVWDHMRAEGTQSLALFESAISDAARVERTIGASVTQSKVVFAYDLLLPRDWLTGFNSCNSTFGALAEFSVNGKPDTFIAFGVAKTSFSLFHGVSGQGVFLDGNLGAGYQRTGYWVQLPELLDYWHNFRVEISAIDGHAQLFLDNKPLAAADFGAALTSVDCVAFEQDRFGACDCIQRTVHFDGPNTPVPEPSSLAMLLLGCVALGILTGRGLYTRRKGIVISE